MPEKISARGLLDKLGLGRKRPEAPSLAPVLEPAPTTMPPESAATKMPSAQESASASGLPDWLSAPSAVEPIPAPMPEAPEVWISPEAPMPVPEVAPELPAVESPAPIPEVKVEVDPFALNREFNGYMETIRQAQAVLASGIALTSEEQRQALIAVARSNSLLPKLPPEVLESVLLMRAVASGNSKFNRDDFQREMLAAINVIKTGTAVKG